MRTDWENSTGDRDEWKLSPGDWILAGGEKDVFDVDDVLIMDAEGETAMVIEDDAEYARVILAMRDAGVRYVPGTGPK